jgi:hypothetical protein
LLFDVKNWRKTAGGDAGGAAGPAILIFSAADREKATV